MKPVTLHRQKTGSYLNITENTYLCALWGYYHTRLKLHFSCLRLKLGFHPIEILDKIAQLNASTKQIWKKLNLQIWKKLNLTLF